MRIFRTRFSFLSYLRKMAHSCLLSGCQSRVCPHEIGGLSPQDALSKTAYRFASISEILKRVETTLDWRSSAKWRVYVVQTIVPSGNNSTPE